MFHDRKPANGQQGFTLVEALVAFIVLAGGLLALLSFHGTVQRGNAEARSQAEAAALAEQKLNELASYTSVADTRLSRVTDGPCPGADGTGSGVADFDFNCDISADNPRDVRVTVTWRDRDDRSRQAVIGSRVALAAPGRDAGGLLALVRAAETADRAVALWPAAAAADGEDSDSNTDDENSEDSPGSGDDEPENPQDPDPPPPLTPHTRIISGTTAHGDDGAMPEIVAVTAQSTPPSIAAQCSRPTRTRFRCAVTYADPRAGWSGIIVLVAGGGQRLRHGAECASTVTLTFTTVTEDVDDVQLSAC